MNRTIPIAERARLDFVLGLRRRWATELYPALVFDARTRAGATGDQDLSSSPVHPWFAWIERGSQKMLWRAATDAVRAMSDEAEAALGQSTSGLGALELDDDLVLPEWYRQVDIHVQPGGVWRSSEAAGVYELGAKLVMLGDNDDYLFHDLFSRTGLAGEQPGRVVDLGCGFGKSTWPLKRQFPDADVVGVDLAAPLLDLAHRRARSFDLDIRFVQADGRNTGLADSSIDLVTSTMLLHELPPKAIEQLIVETSRILAPGGAMRMLDFHLTGDPVRDAVMREHGQRNNEPFMPMMFDTDVEALCRQAGLVDVSWRAFDERGPGLLDDLDWPERSEWHFPWAVLSARKVRS